MSNLGLLKVPKDIVTEILVKDLTSSVKGIFSQESIRHHYQEDASSYYVPRNLFPVGTDYQAKILTSIGEPAPMKFTKELRDYQSKLLLDYVKGEDTIMEIPCGHGKTVISLNLAASLGRRTLVCVPTTPLINQWLDRIQEYLGINAIRIKDLSNIDNIHNIQIITNRLLAIRLAQGRVSKAWLNQFGTVILDELHLEGAASYLPILASIPAKYRIGLTATFRRRDLEHRQIRKHFRNVLYLDNQYPKSKTLLVELPRKDFSIINCEVKIGKERVNNAPDVYEAILKRNIPAVMGGSCIGVPSNYFSALKIIREAKPYIKTWTLFQGKSLNPNLDTFMGFSRVQVIFKMVKELFKKGRKILVLAKRIETLKYLSYLCAKQKIPNCVVIGSEKVDTSKITEPVVLGIQQLAEYGLDIPYLDTLILAHPIGDIQQAYGRIERYMIGKLPSLVIYPWGDFTEEPNTKKYSSEEISLTLKQFWRTNIND